MRRTARQRSYIFIVLEVTFTDTALSVFLKVICVELAIDHFVDNAIPLVLLSVALLHVVLVDLDHARGAADAEENQYSEHQSWPNCNQEQK